MSTILIVLLVLLFVGALPTWSHSANWGLLPQRRVGFNPAHSPHSGSHRTAVRLGVPSRSVLDDPQRLPLPSEFFMNKFHKLGYIDYNGEVHVRRSLLNVLLHD